MIVSKTTKLFSVLSSEPSYTILVIIIYCYVMVLFLSLLLTIIYCWCFGVVGDCLGCGSMATSTTDRLITVTLTIMTSSPPMKTSSSKSSKHGYSHRTKINVPAKFTPLPPKKMDGISNTGSYVRKNSWFQMLLEVWNHFVKCHCHGSSLLRMNAQMTLWPLILSQ